MIVSTLSDLFCIGRFGDERFWERIWKISNNVNIFCYQFLIPMPPFTRPTRPPEPAPPSGRPRPCPGHRQRALQARQEARPEGGTAQERERVPRLKFWWVFSFWLCQIEWDFKSGWLYQEEERAEAGPDLQRQGLPQSHKGAYYNYFIANHLFNLILEIFISRKTTVLEARAANVWAEVVALTVEEVADAMTSVPTGGGTSKSPVILESYHKSANGVRGWQCIGPLTLGTCEINFALLSQGKVRSQTWGSV